MTRAALWLAMEDYSGLWEVVWEFQGLDPSSGDIVNRRAACDVISALLSHGLIELYRCEEPYGELMKIPALETAAALKDKSVWHEPARDAISIRIGATPEGEAAYQAMAVANADSSSHPGCMG